MLPAIEPKNRQEVRCDYEKGALQCFDDVMKARKIEEEKVMHAHPSPLTHACTNSLRHAKQRRSARRKRK